VKPPGVPNGRVRIERAAPQWFERSAIFNFQFSIFNSLALAVVAGQLTIGSAAPVTPERAEFREGFEAYAAGDYEQAAALFRQEAARAPSAGAYHNLGNAEWKLGQTGPAILAWERAQWISPFDANARANLRYARYKAQLPSPSLAWYEICSSWLPVSAWAVLACASFWLALALVFLPGILRWRKADWHQAAAAALLAVFLLTIPALFGVQARARLGIIRTKDTPLRLTPTREAQVLARLAAGELARLERERGDYVYVRAGNDAAGWVERSQFGQIARP
jgi:tetratricopeptide (TPR) repeat protein